MSYSELLTAAREMQPETVALRRAIHRRPEIGLHLPETRRVVLEALAGLPLDIHLHESTSGIVAVLNADKDGPTVLLRGDMDALPLHEDTGLDFSSEIDGAMHACGHDLHTSMLVSAAKLLAGRADELPGKVVFMFQPGEEGYGGARLMIREGLLDVTGERPIRALAQHVSSGLLFGGVACRGGAAMASADSVEVTVHGAGGHASAPHNAIDPVLVAAEVMIGLQTAITREIDVFDPTVLTFAHVVAGTTHNIIPPSAYLSGTLRCVSDQTRDYMLEMIPRVAGGIAQAHRCTAEVTYADGYPVTVNDDGVADRVLELATEIVGADEVVRPPTPIMGAEDWSYVLQQVPGAMAFLDANPPGVDNPPANHSNLVVFNEDCMPRGVAMYAAFAMDALGDA